MNSVTLQGQAMNDSKTRVGLVGCGVIGKRGAHAAACQGDMVRGGAGTAQIVGRPAGRIRHRG